MSSVILALMAPCTLKGQHIESSVSWKHALAANQELPHGGRSVSLGSHGSPCRSFSANQAFCVKASASRETGRAQDGNSFREPAQPAVRPVEKMATSAVALLAAGALLLAPVGDARAAQSGGRVGGSTFKSSRQAPRPASRPAPRVNNSSTTVLVAPSVAPPVFGGYGYSPFPAFGGGWGWSPFSYGPSIVVGGGGGFFSFLIFLFVGGFIFNVVGSLFSGRRNDKDDY